jgi:hypothetical protein
MGSAACGIYAPRPDRTPLSGTPSSGAANALSERIHSIWITPLWRSSGRRQWKDLRLSPLFVGMGFGVGLAGVVVDDGVDVVGTEFGTTHAVVRTKLVRICSSAATIGNPSKFP